MWGIWVIAVLICGVLFLRLTGSGRDLGVLDLQAKGGENLGVPSLITGTRVCGTTKKRFCSCSDVGGHRSENLGVLSQKEKLLLISLLSVYSDFGMV